MPDTCEQIPKEKLLTALERALVNVVNTVGVDINRAVNDPYYQLLLPYISGLGPRKAQVLIKKIVKMVRHNPLFADSQLTHTVGRDIG
jgi:transcription elongation factor SPT6